MMMLYEFLLKYGFAAAVGAALCVFMYAQPRIDLLERQVAQIKEADAEATAKLLAEAAAKEKEYQDEKQKITDEYLAARATADKRAADLSGRVVLLNRAINDYAKSGSCNAVPQANGGAGNNDVSYTLATMVERCNGLLQRGRGLAENAANQIRSLEATISPDTGGR